MRKQSSVPRPASEPGRFVVTEANADSLNPMIRHIPIFAGLSAPALDFLCERARRESFGAGSTILQEGESGNRLFIVGEGRVRVIKHFGLPDAMELAQLGAGDFFGEMCILETLPRSASVFADADGACTLYSLGSTSFLPLYQTMPDQYSILMLNIARDLSRRIRQLDNAVAAKR